MREQLESLAPGAAQAAGEAAAVRLAAEPRFKRASQIVAFSSLADEIDTQPIRSLADAWAKAFLLPRMRGTSIDFVTVLPGAELARARFGVLEPPGTAAPSPVLPGALILVPGLAFDRAGGRLGRGAGYYDRALGRLRAETPDLACVGFGFSVQIVAKVPMSAEDVFLDGLLTEVEWACPVREVAPTSGGVR